MVELHVYQNMLLSCTIPVPVNRQLKTTVCCPWVRHTGMNNYSSQAVGHCMTWNFQSWLLKESINCSTCAMHGKCQYAIHAYKYSQHTDSKNNIPVLEHWGVRAGWHVRCTLNMDTKELWQWGEAVSLPFRHIPVASEHACKDSSKQSVHTWPVRNSSKECTHHSYK